MARLLIPTRNRPTSLASVVGFLERFYPATRLIVADGSTDAFAQENRAAMTDPARKIEIDYRRYPYEMGLFDRLLDVLNGIDDPTIVMASDDDYPLVDALDRAEAALHENPAAVTAMGAMLALSNPRPDEFRASLTVSRSIHQADAKRRCTLFSRWPFPTTYAVARREQLIKRYERAREVFLTGFFDYGVGLHDAACGQIIALPEFTFVATRNYNHSYLRPDGPLHFIRRADEVMRLVAFCRQDLEAHGGLSPEEADETARHLFPTKIVGTRVSTRQAFEASVFAQDPTILAQTTLYERVFRAGTAEHAAHGDRLRFIVDGMREAVASHDNSGDPARVGSLDAQMKGIGTAGADAVGSEADGTHSAADRGEVDGFEAARSRAAGGETASDEEAGGDALGGGRNRFLNPLNFAKTIDPESLTFVADHGAGHGDAVHILALGQSNLASHGAGLRRSEAGTALVDGVRRPLADPVPGGTGLGGSIWPILADKMAANGTLGNLLLSLRAVGGTTVGEWSTGGAPFEDLAAVLPKLAQDNPPEFIVWHQGEADNRDGTTAADYEARFAVLHNLVSRHLPDATWIICRVSYRQDTVAPAVIAGQEAIIDRFENTIAGPNTDHLGASYRSDTTHFNEAGLEAFAGLLYDVLRERIGIKRAERTAAAAQARRRARRQGEGRGAARERGGRARRG
ncbi:MAG: TIGR00180 family glycosyltransferase [Pseudomonadota bacterium]